MARRQAQAAAPAADKGPKKKGGGQEKKQKGKPSGAGVKTPSQKGYRSREYYNRLREIKKVLIRQGEEAARIMAMSAGEETVTAFEIMLLEPEVQAKRDAITAKRAARAQAQGTVPSIPVETTGDEDELVEDDEAFASVADVMTDDELAQAMLAVVASTPEVKALREAAEATPRSQVVKFRTYSHRNPPPPPPPPVVIYEPVPAGETFVVAPWPNRRHQ